jgi:hypothetical protein
MNELALVSVAAGAVIIAVRGPFVLAPAASSAGGRWLIASSARIRVAGVLFAALGLAMIASAQSSAQGAAWVISIVGWFWALAAVFLLLIFTSFYRQIALGIMDALDDRAVMRVLGAIGTLFGAFLVYLGIGVF